MKPALAVIIGRAGSKGLPGKNAMMIAGRPMVAHSVEHAISAETIDRIIVSTDGEAIAEAARHCGVEVIMRPAELATDSAPVDATVRHAVETANASHEIIVILYANVPVRPLNLIDDAVRTLVDNNEGASVQSYASVGKHHPWWMVTLDENNWVLPFNPNTVHRRQDLPKLLIPDGGVIAVRRASLFSEAAIVGDNPHAFLGPAESRLGIELAIGTVIDVDTPLDLAVAEALLVGRRQTSVLHRQDH